MDYEPTVFTESKKCTKADVEKFKGRFIRVTWYVNGLTRCERGWVYDRYPNFFYFGQTAAHYENIIEIKPLEFCPCYDQKLPIRPSD